MQITKLCERNCIKQYGINNRTVLLCEHGLCESVESF